MAIREGAWDCPACLSKGIPGSRKYCGSCGTARGPEVEFYLPEGSREVTEAEEMRRANAGPDWKCPYCNGDNPGFNTHCSGCGSSQDGTQKRATRTILNRAEKPPSAPGPNWIGRILTGCCLMVLLFFVGCWMLTRTTVQAMQVDSMAWQRSIDVEVLGMVTEEGWQGKGEVPSGARVLSRTKGVREHRKVQTGTVSKTRTVTERVEAGTRKVKVGTKDMGNGYFEDVYREETVYENQRKEERYDEPVYRDEPVYDTKVRYQIERWHKESTASEKGQDNKPRWPNVAEAAKRRAGARQESYKIVLKGNGKSYTFETDQEGQFTPFSPGQSVQAAVTALGVVEELKPK